MRQVRVATPNLNFVLMDFRVLSICTYELRFMRSVDLRQEHLIQPTSRYAKRHTTALRQRQRQAHLSY